MDEPDDETLSPSLPLADVLVDELIAKAIDAGYTTTLDLGVVFVNEVLRDGVKWMKEIVDTYAGIARPDDDDPRGHVLSRDPAASGPAGPSSGSPDSESG